MMKQLDGLNLLVKSDPDILTPELLENINNLAGKFKIM